MKGLLVFALLAVGASANAEQAILRKSTASSLDIVSCSVFVDSLTPSGAFELKGRVDKWHSIGGGGYQESRSIVVDPDTIGIIQKLVGVKPVGKECSRPPTEVYETFPDQSGELAFLQSGRDCNLEIDSIEAKQLKIFLDGVCK